MNKHMSIFGKVLLAFSIATSLTFAPAKSETLFADVWADNWFAFYLGNRKIKEDHVSINTERSFNKESFKFSAQRPFVLNFVAKDFKQNNTGLEYIGSRRQQMGDGGLIAHFQNANGKVVAVTNSDWRCLVIHEAPLNKSCERERNPVAGKGNCRFKQQKEPAGWKEIGFDDSSWKPASVYSQRTVRPKDGYDRVRWDRNAEFIWGPDLHTDNTILCRLVMK